MDSFILFFFCQGDYIINIPDFISPCNLFVQLIQLMASIGIACLFCNLSSLYKLNCESLIRFLIPVGHYHLFGNLNKFLCAMSLFLSMNDGRII